MEIIRFSEYCLDFVYPRRCAICGKIVTPKGRLSCLECYPKVKRISGPRCMCCGKQVASEEQEYCLDCLKKERYVEYGFSLWNYNDYMKRSVADYKYHHRKEYADFYCEEFVDEFGEAIRVLKPDALIPIPVHWTRYIERGYNQAEVFAKKVGERLQIPVLDHVLLRNKKTVAQKYLNDKERTMNLQDAFSISKKGENILKGLNRVVLIDDIYTTGSTINICAKLLKQKGMTEVYFGVLCIGAGL